MNEAGSPRGGEAWDAERVRALRSHLGASQQELAERLGTRQQTVSEWETAHSAPRRMSRRLLALVAEEAGFYDARTSADGGAPPARGAVEPGASDPSIGTASSEAQPPVSGAGAV